MKPTKEHFKKKKQNLIITLFLLVIQLIILGTSLYFIQGDVSIYGNISVIFFLLGIPNLVFISMNIVMLLRGEWIQFRYAGPPGERIIFFDDPQQFLRNTFPILSIVFLMIAFGIAGYLFSF